ncbi:MAG: hypothetical protein JWO85_2906 [Candidatus Eremiobacteraeota bacterium]|nr:hypothetical protein [Candidatus Eremiobacteraeota bacterium]
MARTGRQLEQQTKSDVAPSRVFGDGRESAALPGLDAGAAAARKERGLLRAGEGVAFAGGAGGHGQGLRERRRPTQFGEVAAVYASPSCAYVTLL